MKAMKIRVVSEKEYKDALSEYNAITGYYKNSGKHFPAREVRIISKCKRTINLYGEQNGMSFSERYGIK